MINLLMSPSAGRSARRLFSSLSDAVRSVVAPAALVADQAQQAPATAPATAPDPADLYTEADMPAVADIERAALGYDLAADSARSADRAKRKYKKIIGRLPTGLYGGWLISRTPSSRQTVDLEAVTATYKRLGLGPVPMKVCAPSLKVERVTVPVVELAPVLAQVA